MKRRSKKEDAVRRRYPVDAEKEKFRRALRKIVILCGEYGNGVTLDMVIQAVYGVAQRSLRGS